MGGCVSTKLYKTQQPNPDSLFDNADFGAARHIVSLTSTTYGFLKLDSSLEHRRTPFRDERTEFPNPPHIDLRNPDPGVYDPEIINAWELMRDLDDEFGFSKSPKLMNSTTSSTSSKKQTRFSGKENKPRMVEFESRSAAAAAQHVSKPFTSIENNLQKVPNYLKQISIKSSTVPLDVKIDSFRSDTAFLTPKQGFSPLFDPELLTSFEIELDQEREQIKNMVSPPPEKSKHGETECTLLELFEKKTPPPGGENVVVMYTTTLRGIRKTYEDCNRLRSLIESHDVYMIERDVSMDSGFREELRALMGGE
ncbi:hypothetical protein Scep_003337 [Stephania cephalantha]|uniref:Glutaredoxin domain-containing protein n=1 Tax=Stephania cephalantha TaxID=152367 RepID=A0AAP0KQB0_9MAGN